MRIELVESDATGTVFSFLSGRGVVGSLADGLQVSGAYDVEIEFCRAYAFGVDVVISKLKVDHMSIEKGLNKVYAEVVGADEDVIAIRLGGGISFLDVTGGGHVSAGVFVCFYSAPHETVLMPVLM